VIDQHFVFLGALLSLAGSVDYAVQTVRGRTTPNRVTWFMWGTAPIIGFFAQLDEGVGLPSVMTLAIGVGPAVIFVASFFNPAGYWRLTWFDFACGVVSVAALVVWLSLDNPTLAIFFAILADLMGGIPTLRKAWIAPDTEHPSVFLWSAANGVVTLFTIDRWDVATWGFPAYIVAICGLLFFVVQIRSVSAKSARFPHAVVDQQAN
jgi:hypothetical protein